RATAFGTTDDDGNLESIRQTSGNNAHDAVVPALTSDDDCRVHAVAVVSNFLDCFLGNGFCDEASSVRDVLDLHGKRVSFLLSLGKQKLRDDVRRAKASGRVD